MSFIQECLQWDCHSSGACLLQACTMSWTLLLFVWILGASLIFQRHAQEGNCFDSWKIYPVYLIWSYPRLLTNLVKGMLQLYDAFPSPAFCLLPDRRTLRKVINFQKVCLQRQSCSAPIFWKDETYLQTLSSRGIYITTSLFKKIFCQPTLLLQQGSCPGRLWWQI